MSDLYNPDAGYFDVQSLGKSKTWEVSDISDPSSFEEQLADIIQDGYAIPSGE